MSRQLESGVQGTLMLQRKGQGQGQGAGAERMALREMGACAEYNGFVSGVLTGLGLHWPVFLCVPLGGRDS